MSSTDSADRHTIQFAALRRYYIIAISSLLIALFVRRVVLSFIKSKNDAFIVVLGDLGRSPRMNYHCLSLVEAGYRVTMFGYVENKQMSQIESNPMIRIVKLNTFPKWLEAGPKMVQYILKALFLCLNLLVSLLFETLVRGRSVPKFVLVQNPPSIPTLGVVYLYAKCLSSQFIIDWHNYGFTILALKNAGQQQSLLVKICKNFEVFFGRRSNLNFCVTDAMKIDLNSNYNIKAVTMHDKPFEMFRELDSNEKHNFFKKLSVSYKLDLFADPNGNQNETLFTKIVNKKVEFKPNRPALIVSSSSWTEDEDFHLLIEALKVYDENKLETMPNIICALTGKGPLKQYYEEKFSLAHFTNVQVIFLWLDPNDYPLLLGASDLGVSLHQSSSNLDLPMKVVDMFGTRLPVCALNFKWFVI
jgi:beta-1,4-mannosyltransferase